MQALLEQPPPEPGVLHSAQGWGRGLWDCPTSVRVLGGKLMGPRPQRLLQHLRQLQERKPRFLLGVK